MQKQHFYRFAHVSTQEMALIVVRESTKRKCFRGQIVLSNIIISVTTCQTHTAMQILM